MIYISLYIIVLYIIKTDYRSMSHLDIRFTWSSGYSCHTYGPRHSGHCISCKHCGHLTIHMTFIGHFHVTHNKHMHENGGKRRFDHPYLSLFHGAISGPVSPTSCLVSTTWIPSLSQATRIGEMCPPTSVNTYFTPWACKHNRYVKLCSALNQADVSTMQYR